MTRTLVVYHSRTGRTRRVAQALARGLAADLQAIEPVRERSGLLGYLRCALEALGRVQPLIRDLGHEPSRYDLLVIGTPVWFWRLSSPVRTFVHRYVHGAQRVAFFCTMGGQGSEGVFAELAALCGRAPIATLALTEREADRGDARRLGEFVQALALHSARRRSRASVRRVPTLEAVGT